MYVCWKCRHEHNDDLTLICTKCGAVNPATSKANKTLDVKPEGFSDRLNARLRSAGLLENKDLFTLEIGDKQIYITFKTRLVIGRDFDEDETTEVVDLGFYNAHRAGVSRRHAALQRDEQGQVVLIDLGSTNGTYLNDNQLVSGVGHPLSDGDMVHAANLELVIRFDSASDNGK